jgi:hypothetical protein
MTEHLLEKDLVLIKFDAVNILDVDPESMSRLLVENVPDRKIVSMGKMGFGRR